MADKDTKSKSTAKSSASAKTTAKPTSKSTANKAATVKPAAKTSAPAKKSTAAKPVSKSSAPAKKTAAKSPSAAEIEAAMAAAKLTVKSKPNTGANASSAKSEANTGDKSAKDVKKSEKSKESAGKTDKSADKPAKAEESKKTAKPSAKASDKIKSDEGEKSKTVKQSSAKENSKEKAESGQKAKSKEKSSKDTDEKQAKTEKTKKENKSAASENQKNKKTVKSGKADDSDRQQGGKKKTVAIIISAVSIVLMIAIIIGIVLGAKSCNANGGVGNALDYPYNATTPIGYASKVLGYTNRVKPIAEMRNGGLPEYPQYGKTLSSVIGSTPEKEAARNALISESSYLTSTNTWNGGGGGYTWMDEKGFLYSGSTYEPVKTLDAQNNHRQLYKHTASVGLYGGDVADDEPAVIKEVTLRPRGYNSYSVTGLYAPAGEVIKIQLSEKDMEATGGITIHIGQALYNGKANNIWTAKNHMQRFPVILNTMVVNKDHCTFENGGYTAYVGSFLGGPIYVRNTSATVKVTISGGIPYSHFILGYTTPEEFEQNSKTSAPYFDMEVWSCGVLHSGPKMCAKPFSYDDLYKAAILWEKVSLVTTTNSKQGIVFLYDPFVAAGAAVAFPGQGSVNCPTGWMASSLNYKQLVTSGAWGNFHEYHHNFQHYGVGAGGEVTNNGMTLVSYSLFTKISAARSLANYGASGLSGWNRYTSAPFALEQALRIGRPNQNPENGDRGLSLYATLLHNFGADNYIQAKVKQQRTGAYGENYAGYLRAWQDITHNNMSYYFNKILKADLGNQYDNPDYPMFIPVASTYQTGRNYTYDGVKKNINTMQPYVITYGEDFTLDFRRYENNSAGQYVRGSIVLPDDFNYTIKNITQPEYGEIVKVEEGVYTYKPDKNHVRSGKITLTLGLSKANPDDSSINFALDDVELIIELEQSHENNKYMLNRTTYVFEEGNTPTDAIEAFNSGYSGHVSKIEGDNKNHAQNSNADVWYNYTDNQSPLNSVVEVRGKIYVEEEGKYRIALRGRYNVALFVSLDGGKTYELAAHKNTTSTANGFDFNNPETYKDYELKSDTWVYFKEVLINNDEKRNSFVGLGWGMFTPPQGVIDEDGNVVGATEETISVKYATAYRESYEFHGEFETEYFYKWKGTYNYTDNRHANENQTVVSTNYESLRVPPKHGWGNFPLENLTDGKTNTYIHTIRSVSDNVPLEFEIDMGEAKAANRMTIYSQYRPNGDYMVPCSYNLYGSLDGQEYFTIGEFRDIPRTGSTSVVRFEEKTFRYYKLQIVKSTGSYVIISEIELKRDFEVHNGEQFAPSNEKFNYSGKWNLHITHSTFGSVFVGRKNSTLGFEFEGTRIAVLSSASFGTNFEVYIDGKRVSSLETKPDENEYRVSYLSPELENGKHSVTIKCKGEASIDSIVVFPEQ